MPFILYVAQRQAPARRARRHLLALFALARLGRASASAPSPRVYWHYLGSPRSGSLYGKLARPHALMLALMKAVTVNAMSSSR